MATEEGIHRDRRRRWHPEGIPWPFSLLYAVLSRTNVFRMHYGLVADEAVRCAPGAGRVLDVGTGPGWLLGALRERLPGAALLGVDISPSMARLASRNLAAAGCSARAGIVCAGAAALPFAGASFDLVLSTGSLHHWKDRAAGLDEVWRVLKPGCRALIYDLVRRLPPEVSREMRPRLGRFRMALLRLHSFEEPFPDPGEMLSLAGRTRFEGGETHFTGALCCLVLRKGA